MFILFAWFALGYHNIHDQYSNDVKETIKRYSRDTNTAIGEIKGQRFDRKLASAKSIKFFKESEKFK